MDIVLRKPAQKALGKMPAKRAAMIRDALKRIAADPQRAGVDVRPLRGRPGLRLRSGDWRIIFEITENALIVLDVAARGSAYRSSQ